MGAATPPGLTGAPRHRRGRSGRTRLAAVAAVLVAVAGVVAVVVGLTLHRTPAAAPLPPPSAAVTTGTDWGAVVPSSVVPARRSGAGDRLPGPLPPTNSPDDPAHRAGGTTRAPAPASQPDMPARSIRIPSQHVTAAIGAATVTDGVLTPPRIPDTVGEWAGSAPLDATSGEVTLAGHVNWAGMSRFAFAGLAYLRPGDLLYTTDDQARVTAWRITRVYARPKSEPIDAAAFHGTQGPRTLTLITCGGSFDASDASYEANVYVTATPAHPHGVSAEEAGTTR